LPDASAFTILRASSSVQFMWRDLLSQQMIELQSAGTVPRVNCEPGAIGHVLRKPKRRILQDEDHEGYAV
jgi:hypothetical protein